MSSILKKIVMAVTGLALVGFLITHLAGNLSLFGGPGLFNAYAQKLHNLGLLLIVAEAGLLLLFVVHIVNALRLTIENKNARGSKDYAVSNNQSTLASRMMWITGFLILGFVVLHVAMFKFGKRPADPNAPAAIVKAAGEAARPAGLFDHEEEGSLYHLVQSSFKNPLVVGFYVFMMLVLGVHLSHGISSAFQSLGALRPGWLQKLRPWGVALAWLLAIGFAILPICAFLGIGIK